MIVATWNLERPRQNSRRNALRIQKLLSLNADILILTETHRVIDLGPGYRAVTTAPSPRKPRKGEAVAAIWYRTDRYTLLQQLETSDVREAACIQLGSPNGNLLVYASIIPYHGYKGPNGSSGAWVEHERAIGWHGADWASIRRSFPNHLFVAGGDYNQARDGVGGYGTEKVRGLLSEALSKASLTCVTEEDFVAVGKLRDRHSVDHICCCQNLAERPLWVDAWEGTADGVRLSDHNGVVVHFPSSA